ncbi:hypothetical protein [Streptosporangium sp. NPDC001681]|uniref:hypothetical protein n=1 Tax=Streptosporangium sp. NPDC001681 TaxID=3154395 RepID=UPI003318D425
MAELSGTTMDLLEATLDVDAHEMTPSHLWGEACAREPAVVPAGAAEFNAFRRAIHDQAVGADRVPG